MRALVKGMLLLVSASAGWPMSVTLESSLQNSSQIGTEVNLYASVSDISHGPIWYRFRIRPTGAAKFRMVWDYSPARSINWVPTQKEGSYEIEVSARNLSTGETDVETSSYNVESLVTGNAPVISRT